MKDVQGNLGHTKADTTVNVYMQPIEEGVKQTLDAIYAELTAAKVVAVSGNWYALVRGHLGGPQVIGFKR